MNRVEQLIKSAQEADLKYRSSKRSWSRVPDDQVFRLLVGTGLVKLTDADARRYIEQSGWALAHLADDPKVCPKCGTPSSKD